MVVVSMRSSISRVWDGELKDAEGRRVRGRLHPAAKLDDHLVFPVPLLRRPSQHKLDELKDPLKSRPNRVRVHCSL